MNVQLNTRTLTGIILVAATVLLIAWDIYVAATPQRGDTISELVLDFARRHPIVPFSIGVVIGHLFWSQQ